MAPASQLLVDTDSEHGRNDSDSSRLSSPISKPESLLADHLRSQISPQRGRGRTQTVRSYQSSSSDLSSEVAPEIVVWTEDMDLDSDDELSDPGSLSDVPMSK
jgi:vacuolar protein sorting-associated protein 33A